MIFGPHENFTSSYQGESYLPVFCGKCGPSSPCLFLSRIIPGAKNRYNQQRQSTAGPCWVGHSLAKQRRRMADRCVAWRSKAKAKLLLHSLDVPGVLSFLIQDICYTEQISGWPYMNIDFFRRPGVCVPENDADELDGDIFYIQCCGKVMAQGVGPKTRYPGVPGKFFAKIVQSTFCLEAL